MVSSRRVPAGSLAGHRSRGNRTPGLPGPGHAAVGSSHARKQALDRPELSSSPKVLGQGDVDPNPEINVWTSTGGTHLWAQTEIQPMTAWQAELDHLMQRQTTILDYR